MRETRNGRPGRNVDDAVIDAVAGALMRHEPAAGLGRRVVTRLDQVTGPRSGLGGFGLWIRMAVAGVLLAVVASLWPASRPRQVPESSQPPVATRVPSPATVAPPAQEPAAAAPEPTRRPLATAIVRAPRGQSRADRLWAARSAPAVERIVVAPVSHPDPLTVDPLELAAIAVDDLSIEPLAIDALDVDGRHFPDDTER
jgi:hypothetical protein